MMFKKLLPESGLISKRSINSFKKGYKNQDLDKSDIAKYAVKSYLQGKLNVFPGSVTLLANLLPQIDIRPKLKGDKVLDEVTLRNYKAHLLKKARNLRDNNKITEKEYLEFINNDKLKNATTSNITDSIKNSGKTYRRDYLDKTEYQKLSDYLNPLNGDGNKELNKLLK